MILIKEFIEVQGDLYEVCRKIHESPDVDIEHWKNILYADKAFRQNGFLFFCKLIQEAEIVENEVEIIS